MEFNQSFKAPSIPKLSKRTISSPFGEKSALAAPKLKKTSFSFIKGIKSVPSSIFQKLEDSGEEKREGGLTKVLSDTNKIFGEIRDQLALDFTTRIADAKKSLSKIKQDSYKKRRGLKEGLISGAKSIGSGIMGQVNQILAPTKSIFEKIIEFFQIILTGIILNNAFTWLQKKENREKVIQIFKFVADHWKELLILFGTFKLLGLLFKIIRVAKAIKNFLDLFRKKPPGGGPCGCDDKKPKGGGPYDPCAPVLNCLKDINGPTAEALAERIANTTRFKPLFGLLGITALKPKPIQTPRPQPTANQRYLQSLPPGVREDALKGGKTASPLGDLGIMAAVAAVVGPIITALGIGGAGTTAGGAGTAGSLNAISKIVRFSRATATSPIAKADGGTIPKFSPGGTVGGRGKPKADDVPAWLSTGEEVTRTAMAMLWRPLLKDINESGGKLFDQFRQGVVTLNDLVKNLISNSKIFRDITGEFNNYLKGEIQKKKLKNATGGGTGRIVSMKPSQMVSSENNLNQRLIEKPKIISQNLSSLNTQSIGKVDFAPSVNQNINLNVVTTPNKVASRITPTTSGSTKPVIVPMTLPPISGKMPEIPTPTATSSEVPDISSVNMANPYMQMTSKAYGIYVI